MDAFLKYLIIGVSAVFAIVVIAFLAMRSKLQGKDAKYKAQLVEGTKASSFSMDVFYQKFYVRCSRIPLISRYLLKLRRRLEIINLEDEFVTRKQTAQILFKAIIIAIPLTAVVIMLTKQNTILMLSVLLFEFFFIEVLMEGMVDKIDNNLLRQQINFFAEVRHAFHEFNMVEEAIYDVSQNDELDISRQGLKVYEILISDDPETELEKYYDIAPNSYLKEFAGVSYLTKEFGDRKDKDGASLYLKNLNNITQEMQIEILKRDKLDYVFQSLSMIAAVPILCIDFIKGWAVDNFGFTSKFYEGSLGFIAQIGLIILTFICFILVRKLKDNGSINTTVNLENPWQAKIYKNKLGKKIVDLFITKQGTKDYRKTVRLLKDSASKLKMEWLYINKIAVAILCFIVLIALFNITHFMTVNYIYTEPTSDYNLLGTMSDSQSRKAMKLTEADNVYLDKYRYDQKVTVEIIAEDLEDAKEYPTALTEEEITTTSERIFEKLGTIQKAYFKWYELLICFVGGIIGFYGPVLLLIFQKIMRQMEMENEVMQFQTIILMLMKIERVNVEMILEWLERYSNIFREPISKCVNNYESGAWEALEELKNDVTFDKLIRIVESLQASVEQIPIRQAFDELDTERSYYQEKRKEANDRLIARKAMIGKILGFGPMVVLFVGYLIVPLCLIGMTSMTQAFDTMSTMS